MALEIKWSKRADQKFDKIIDYLSTDWGTVTPAGAFSHLVMPFLPYCRPTGADPLYMQTANFMATLCLFAPLPLVS